MIKTHADPHATGCAEVRARILEERTKPGSRGMHSIGGWHTEYFRVGAGWLGEAVRRRLAQSGYSTPHGLCWGNVLPPGAAYGAHVSRRSESRCRLVHRRRGRAAHRTGRCRVRGAGSVRSARGVPRVLVALGADGHRGAHHDRREPMIDKKRRPGISEPSQGAKGLSGPTASTTNPKVRWSRRESNPGPRHFQITFVHVRSRF